MRYLTKYILSDLQRKMVFVGGARQVGKTTLAKSLLESEYPDGGYFNWDYDEDRQAILAKKWTQNAPLLVFDELHKYPGWKNWIKGLYDVKKKQHAFLVTGSARLDIYQKGGDSLLGRYHYWRLHPFSLDEYPAGIDKQEAFNRLMTVGGFPEPFLENDPVQSRRWRRDRLNRVIREDIRDLENIHKITGISLMLDLLRSRVGSMLVLENLARDIQVSSKTIKHWLTILQQMYLVFSIKPYTKNLPRAILKPAKVYFYDNADVIGDQGAIFENLVATGLLKRIHFLQDRDGYNYELRYIRDKEGREVDFVILKDNSVEELIEVKYADDELSSHLKYYAKKIKAKKVTQIVAKLDRSYDQQGIRITDPLSYFSNFCF
ncbi:MAG: ATP-binding protein [Enterobacterales bacterium]|nr:ATP-binding protein [Enterobacterales bacterium]